MSVEQLLRKGSYKVIRDSLTSKSSLAELEQLALAEVYQNYGKYRTSISLLLDLINQTKKDEIKAEAMVILGYNRLYLSEHEEDLLNFIKSIDFGQLSPRFEIEYIVLLATHLTFQGEYTEAETILHGYLDTSDDYYRGRICHAFGVLLHFQGSYVEAIKYYQTALPLFERLEHTTAYCRTLHNIANIYFNQGEVGQAYLLFQEEIARLNEEDLEYTIGLALTDIAYIHFQQGRYEDAKEAIDESNRLIREAEGSEIDIVENDMIMIQTLTELGEIEEAREVLENLRGIFKNTSNHRYYPYLELAEAIVMHCCGRTREKAKALDICEDILSRRPINIDIYILAIRYTIRFLLEEYRAYESQESLFEIDQLCDLFLQTARDANASSFIPEVYLYKGMISVIQRRFEEAEYILMDGFLLAQTRELQHLAKLISLELEKIPKPEIGSGTVNNPEMMQTLDNLTRARWNEQIDEEEPVTVFVVNRPGALLYSKEYQHSSTMEPNLIANFISAMNSFAKETFASSGTLERIKHGQYTILMDEYQGLIFGYVFRGHIYHAITKLQNFIGMVQNNEEFWYSIDDFHITKEVHRILDRTIDEVFS